MSTPNSHALPRDPLRRWSSMLALIVPLFILLALSVWWAVGLWNAVEGPPMPLAGYVAMWLGVLFSLVIGCGLMALAFYSSCYGHADRPEDGGRRCSRTRARRISANAAAG